MTRFAITTLLLLLAAASSAAAPADEPEWGVTLGGWLRDDPEALESALGRLREAGLTAVRVEAPWAGCLDLASDPGNTTRRWVRRLRREGLQVLVIVGCGFRGSVPPEAVPGGDEASRRRYLDGVAAHALEVAATLAPEGVHDYQVENELNAAGLATLEPFAWRRGAAWWDPRFKDRLIEALAAAVREGDPEARVHVNLHDHVHDGRGVDATLRAWAPRVDVVGIDYYPNYLLPFPVRARGLAGRLRRYREVSGRPVEVAETGYPSRGYGHTPGLQAAFVGEACDAAVAGGARACYFYTLADGGERPWGLDPDEAVEPYFGLLDGRLEPKGGRASAWEVLRGRARRYR